MVDVSQPSSDIHSTSQLSNHVKPEYRVKNYQFVEGVERFSDADPDYARAMALLERVKETKRRKFSGVATDFDEYQRLLNQRDLREAESIRRHNANLCDSGMRSYVQWVQQPILLVFRHVNESGEKFSVRRAAKRGDKMYRKQVLNRMNPIFEACEAIDPFFNRKTRTVNSLTNCLYITGTIPHDKGLKEAWRESLPYYFNLFMTRIRRKYGKTLIVWRTWEAHESGYPHFHAIILFPEHKFTCFRYKGKWRVHSRDELRSYWGSTYNHSSKTYEGLLDGGAMFNMDIQAMDSLKGGLSYVAKYITKATKAPEGYQSVFEGKIDPSIVKQVLTLSLMWRFHKRAYSTSKGFVTYVNALIVGLGNSTGSSDFAMFWATLDPYLVELIGFYYGEGNAEWFCGWLPDRLKVPLYLDPCYCPRRYEDVDEDGDGSDLVCEAERLGDQALRRREGEESWL